MGAAEPRREFLISKGWIQAVVLVVLFGFFVLGLLAYRTYRRSRRSRRASSTRTGRVLYTGDDISQGQQVFLHNGLMEYGSVFGHGAYLGPGLHRRLPAPLGGPRPRTYGGPASDCRRRAGRSRTSATNRYDEKTGTLHADRAAGGRRSAGSSRYYSALLLGPDDRARAAAGRDHGPTAAPPADRLLRLDGLGGVGERGPATTTRTRTTGPRAARRQQADRERDRLVGALADRPAGRDRAAVRRVRALGRLLGWHGREQATLSFRSPGDVALTPAQRATRVVLLRDGGAVPDPDARRRRLPALPRRDLTSFFGIDLAQRLPVQPDAHLARAARDLLGLDLVRRRRDLPRADDRPARAAATRASSPTRCSARSRSSCSAR